MFCIVSLQTPLYKLKVIEKTKYDQLKRNTDSFVMASEVNISVIMLVLYLCGQCSLKSVQTAKKKSNHKCTCGGKENPHPS